MSVKAEPQKTAGPQECAGCGKKIQDRFLLKALDMYWHEDCLKCGCCDCRLGEVGSTLYTKGNLLLCRRDYLRLFGTTGYCSACNKVIPAFEMVMRARTNVYHLECFACQQCNHRFCVGDRFFLCDNKILCEYDYEERMVFANLAYNSSNLASQMKSNNRSNNGPANGPSATGPNAAPVSSATGLKDIPNGAAMPHHHPPMPPTSAAGGPGSGPLPPMMNGGGPISHNVERLPSMNGGSFNGGPPGGMMGGPPSGLGGPSGNMAPLPPMSSGSLPSMVS